MTGFKNRPVKTQAAPQNPSTSAAAWIPQLKDGKPAVWRFTGTDQCKKLKVKFIHDQDFSPVKYDTKLILEWANEWNDHGRDKSIPFFVEAKNEEKAQIRVKLNGIPMQLSVHACDSNCTDFNTIKILYIVSNLYPQL